MRQRSAGARFRERLGVRNEGDGKKTDSDSRGLDGKKQEEEELRLETGIKGHPVK